MFDLTPEQKQIRGLARELAQGNIRARAAEVDRSGEYPRNNVRLLTGAGFMGMCIPQEYGGQGAGYLDAVLVVEEMAKSDCVILAGYDPLEMRSDWINPWQPENVIEIMHAANEHVTALQS